MTDKARAQVGLWLLERRELDLGSLAIIMLVILSGLMIRDWSAGNSWRQIWPTGLSAFAMVMLLIGIARRARSATGAE